MGATCIIQAAAESGQSVRDALIDCSHDKGNAIFGSFVRTKPGDLQNLSICNTLSQNAHRMLKFVPDKCHKNGLPSAACQSPASLEARIAMQCKRTSCVGIPEPTKACTRKWLAGQWQDVPCLQQRNPTRDHISHARTQL